jgi:hypothetical protein
MHDVVTHEVEAEHVHVPQSSFAPIVLSIGIFFLNLAFVFGLPFAIVGAIVFAAGTAQWIREDMTYFRRGGAGHE